MQSAEIRQKFLNFFEKRGHVVIPSASLVPANDASVLFTTAGMQQFKPYYVGKADALKDFNTLNLASSQKCVRTTDIEEVGDQSHLTFFEMLGNFSFGDYFKKEAIEYAWEFITGKDWLGISPDRIYVTVHESIALGRDEVSYDIWKNVIKLPEDKIKFGGIEDNFWGPTGSSGPCGPSTEIYVDGIEIWNIVFNQFVSKKSREQSLRDGWEMESEEIKGVDTGMGLERLVKVLQKTETVFETDLLKPVMEVADSRIVADHIRTSCFMITDGVTPSNTDRGYILRRLLRRAYVKNKDVNPVIEAVVNHPSYKGLYTFAPNIKEVMAQEFEKFRETLNAGLKQIKKGEDPFILFTSYGLPLEIIKEVVPAMDEAKFQKQMEEHRQISSAAGEQKFSAKGGSANPEGGKN